MRSLRIIFVLLAFVYTSGQVSAQESGRKEPLVGDSTPTSDTLSFPGLSVLPSRPQGAARAEDNGKALVKERAAQPITEAGHPSRPAPIPRSENSHAWIPRYNGPPNGPMTIQLQGTIQSAPADSLSCSLTWNDPNPRTRNYILWRYDSSTGWTKLHLVEKGAPTSYIDNDPLLVNRITYKYLVQNGNDVSNDLSLTSYFAKQADP